MKNIILLFLFGILFGIDGYDTENHLFMNKKEDSGTKFPTIIDACKIDTPALIETMHSKVFYIGEYHDIISIDCSVEQTYFRKYFLDGDEGRFDENRGLEVLIDTTQKIKIEKSLPDSEKDNFAIEENTHYAYPIMLKNNGKDTVFVCFTNSFDQNLAMAMQAKNELGIWQFIENIPENRALCIYGIYRLFLPPQNIIITSAIKYEGKFKTKLRLKIGDMYSPVFEGQIQQKQFKKGSEAFYYRPVNLK